MEVDYQTSITGLYSIDMCKLPECSFEHVVCGDIIHDNQSAAGGLAIVKSCMPWQGRIDHAILGPCTTVNYARFWVGIDCRTQH